MIRFECHNCGKSVSVQDSHAGKSGRCPQCMAIVTIPVKPSNSRNDNVEALVAALQGKNADSGLTATPSNRARSEETIEFELIELQTSSASETDTYPAIKVESEADDNDSEITQSAPIPLCVSYISPGNAGGLRSLIFVMTVLAAVAFTVAIAVFVCWYL